MAAPLQHVQYDLTADDIVARFRRAPVQTQSALRTKGALGMAVTTGAVTWFVLDTPRSAQGGTAMWSVLAAVAIGAGAYLLQPRAVQWLTERMIRKSMPTPHRLQVELWPDHLAIEREAQRTRVAWAAVEQIDDAADDVVLRADAVTLVVPPRAFATAAARTAFVAAARQLAAAAS